jgi:hypothetical protein
MTAAVTSAAAIWFEAAMYVVIFFGALDVVRARSGRVGRSVTALARVLAVVCMAAAIVGIGGLLLHDIFIFRLSWLLMGIAGAVVSFSSGAGIQLTRSAGVVAANAYETAPSPYYEH